MRDPADASRDAPRGRPDRRRRGAWRAPAAIAVAAFASAVAAFAALVAWPEPQAPLVPRADFAVREVAVVDVATGGIARGQTIVVRDGRIEATGPDAALVPSPGLRVIDGRGRYAMPALWDMHAHLYAVSPLLDLPQYVAWGVTGVRDMQGCPRAGDPFIACAADKRRWSAEAVAGKRVGPRLVSTTSFMANGPGMAARIGGVPAYFDTSDAEQARAFVRHFAGEADAIKVYDRIPADAWRALVDEARLRGIDVVGHRPHAVAATEAARHHRSLEHARFLLHESFDGADALRASAGTARWREDRRAMVDRHDRARAAAIFAAMRAHGTHYVPTHLTRWVDAHAGTPAVDADPAAAALHPLLRMQWREDIDATLAADPSPDGRRDHVDFFEKGLSLTLAAHRAGVPVMVGTDYIAPGLDVHRELALLVRAGLTPAEALRAATVVPAAFAGRSGEFGAIAPGFAADFILLDGDPLADIANTRRLHGVAFAGSYLDDAALRAIRAHGAGQSRSWSVGAKIVWRFLRSPASY